MDGWRNTAAIGGSGGMQRTVLLWHYLILTAADSVAEIVTHQIEDINGVFVGVRAVATLVLALDEREVRPRVVDTLYHPLARILERRAADETFGRDIAEHGVRTLEEIKRVERSEPHLAAAVVVPLEAWASMVVDEVAHLLTRPLTPTSKAS